jgi:hypothetical protein
MTDASAILASLDRFIERFSHDAKLRNDHRVVTQAGPVVTVNPLTCQATNHSYHSGHPKQETFAGVDHKPCDSHPSLTEISGARLARQVLSLDGYSGKNGKSVSYQQLAGSHRENADGHSGSSFSDPQLASGLTGTCDQAGHELGMPPNASRLDPTIWSDLYEERAAYRQFDGGYPRVEAELFAWREMEWRWHFAHREKVPAEVCAGCGQLIGEDKALDLIDGARVHIKGHRCRIAYEQRWRRAASNALVALGLPPPGPIGHRCPR